MALKSFDELLKLDITEHLEERDDAKGAKYLPWVKCILLLHENGAEKVYFTPISNKNGHSLFMTEEVFEHVKKDDTKTHRCYEVKVKITIDDMEWLETFPLMNGIHPVMDNSINQLRISNAHKRAFVKGTAVRTGLGLGLWIKDEGITPSLESHDIMKIKERVEEKITRAIKKYSSVEEVYRRIGLSEKRVNNLLSGYKKLAEFEKSLGLL